ncbi:MAG: 7-cyano-7-deazaguanine synthase [Candidatus Omnitrophica bacterium CG11_big_fil_rev_8_21_14_0_20_64_10]|nr:MAG: 7-cyano-7-deazaguanine synthase [Candidatus Omnitrophica bacterium CG11_big_fil_rev_8_21_14_0_20_64_10]
MTISGKPQAARRKLAVLVSGGVESAALLHEGLRLGRTVYPIHVRKGFRWEGEEGRALARMLTQQKVAGLQELTIIRMDLRAVIGRHWGMGDGEVPSAAEPDEAVYLPGRNLLLLGQAALFCATRRIPTLWIGTLKGNPFPDASASFNRRFSDLFRQGTGFSLKVEAPFAGRSKGEVLKRCPPEWLQRSFSCIQPVRSRHCGRCQKCGERKKGFRNAGLEDPTSYVG